jgi:biotin transporter BioY
MNDYIEQPIMNDGNGTAGPSGTGPSAGYTFVFLFFFTRFLAGLAGNKKEYIYNHNFVVIFMD